MRQKIYVLGCKGSTGKRTAMLKHIKIETKLNGTLNRRWSYLALRKTPLRLEFNNDP